jgi:hypothetical protein
MSEAETKHTTAANYFEGGRSAPLSTLNAERYAASDVKQVAEIMIGLAASDYLLPPDALAWLARQLDQHADDMMSFFVAPPLGAVA